MFSRRHDRLAFGWIAETSDPSVLSRFRNVLFAFADARNPGLCPIGATMRCMVWHLPKMPDCVSALVAEGRRIMAELGDSRNRDHCVTRLRPIAVSSYPGAGPLRQANEGTTRDHGLACPSSTDVGYVEDGMFPSRATLRRADHDRVSRLYRVGCAQGHDRGRDRRRWARCTAVSRRDREYADGDQATTSRYEVLRRAFFEHSGALRTIY